MDEFELQIKPITESEVRIERTRGSGSGGQHKNSTDSRIVMTHIQTGIKVISDGRHQAANLEEAYKEMGRRVNDHYNNQAYNEYSVDRHKQVGSGHRSDKRRTYRVKDDLVIDHITGKTTTIKNILKGNLELLQ